MQIDVFTLGKELEKYVTIRVEVFEMAAEMPKFSWTLGEYDDVRNKITLRLWSGATRKDALALLAHEYTHAKEKGLSEVETWRKGESYAKEWGVLPEYLKLARALVMFYERRGLYPGLAKGMRKWLETRGGKTIEIKEEAVPAVGEITDTMKDQLAEAMFEASEGRGYFKDVAGFRKHIEGWAEAEIKDTYDTYVRVGKIKPEAKPPAVSVIEYDRQHSLEELREKAKQEGLSPSGSKKEIAARLIAKGVT